MTGEVSLKSTEGQAGLCTESNCDYCGSRFTPKNRNGLTVRFCQAKCSRGWHNAQRLKGAALLKAQTPAVQRPRKARGASIRTLDQLSAAEGLPAGSYGAGALGRIGRHSVAQLIPPSERLGLLVEAAKRLSLTEGTALTAARQAAQQETACA